MHRFRQIVLLLLVSLLSAGPALAALMAPGCMARKATCPMCTHPAQPTHCAGQQGSGRGMDMHASQQPAISSAAMQAVAVTPAAPQAAAEPACLCPGQQGLRTADVLIAPKLKTTLPATSAPPQTAPWRLARHIGPRAPSPGAVSIAVRRAGAPLPLRV